VFEDEAGRLMRSWYGYLEFLDVVKERRKPSPRLGDSAELMSFIVKAKHAFAAQ